MIDLCDEIIRRKINIVFHATTRTDWVDDFVLKKMKESWMSQNRFRHRDRISNAARKDGQEQRCETSVRAIRLVKQTGIAVTALLIIGSVGRDPGNRQRNGEFLEESSTGRNRLRRRFLDIAGDEIVFVTQEEGPYRR